MFTSLRAKLLVPILAFMTIGMAGLGGFSYWEASKSLEISLKADAHSSVQGIERIMSRIIDNVTADLNGLVLRIDVHNVLDPKKDRAVTSLAMHSSLKNLDSIHPEYGILGVVDTNGIIVASTDTKAHGLNYKDKDFVKSALANKRIVSQAYFSPITNGAVVALSAPVFAEDGKTIIGLVYVGLSLPYISEEYVKEASVGDPSLDFSNPGKGYAFIVEKGTGNVVAHPVTKNVLDPQFAQLPVIKKLAAKTEDGTEIDAYNGHEVFYSYGIIKETNWVVVVRGGVDNLFASVTQMRNFSIALSIGVLLFASLVTFLIVRNITSALSTTAAYAQSVASGNLDGELALQRGDELGVLAGALRTMVGELKSMIAAADEKTQEAVVQSQKAKEAAETAEKARLAAESAKREGLHVAGDQLGTIVAQAQQASTTLAGNVDAAAEGAEAQRARTAETATAMEEMNATVYEVAQNASSAAASADQARSNALHGEEVVSGVVAAISDVDKKTTDLKRHLNELGERAQGIGQIMNVITDIADQTNLLALNAAIEAARAGDAGRGFAVVADEVRKLAEKTMAATKEVGDAVSAIQAGTVANIEGMEEAAVSVGRSTEMAQEAGASLKTILHIAESTADKVRSIATASEEQSAASEEITRGTDEVNRVADETAGLMQEAASVVQELMGLIRQISAIVEEFKKA